MDVAFDVYLVTRFGVVVVGALLADVQTDVQPFETIHWIGVCDEQEEIPMPEQLLK